MPTWKSIYPEHSIEQMALVFSFSETLGSLATKKTLRALEIATTAAGLDTRVAIENIEIKMSLGGLPTPAPAGQTGMVFQKTANVVLNGQNVRDYITDQVQLDSKQLMVRTWRYTRWTNFKELTSRLITDAMNIIGTSVPISSVHLEYNDRFYFDGNANDARPSFLFLENSSLITPSVLAAEDLWHSHTGELVKMEEGVKRLIALNADCADFLAGPLEGKRTVSLISTVEDRFTNPLVLEAGLDDSLWERCDALHDEAANILHKTLKQRYIRMIGMGTKQ